MHFIVLWCRSSQKEDPYCEASGAHFGDLLCRYGSPIIILNLLKRKEKRFQEGLLTEGMHHAFEYANQFLPREHRIRFRAFDVARCQKSKNSSVLCQLTYKAKRYLAKTGIFHVRSTSCTYIREKDLSFVKLYRKNDQFIYCILKRFAKFLSICIKTQSLCSWATLNNEASSGPIAWIASIGPTPVSS